MKYFYTIILGLLLRVSAIGQETPAITMTTTKAMGSTISIGLEAIASTTIRIDFGDGNKMAYIIENKISTISGTVGASQVLKIYGTGINYLLCQDNNLTLLDVTKCPDLIELYCFNNQLTNIDLTNNQNLIDLQCYRNRLNVLDVSYCPKLTWLECHSNSLTSLKLNTNLLFLNCELNMLNTLDINNSTRIAELICYGNQLTSLNLENVTSLKKLDCSRNQLTSLNVSNQIQLVELQCWENKLGSLNVSNNAKLSTLDCSSNKLSLSSLPLKQGNWSLYKYNLQSPLTIPTTIYIEGMLNLSGQYSINGNNTTYTWKASNGYVLIENTDYKNDKGRITFIKAQGEYDVYCQMTNAAFPDLILETTKTKISSSPKQTQTITFTALSSQKVGDSPFTLSATTSSNLQITYTSSDASIASISGNKITIHKAGSVTITASQSGDSNWNAAEPVTQTLTISKKAQTINFEAISAKKIKDAPFTLKASSSSNLPITYTSSDPLVASVNGSTVTILKAGTVTITATQAGNEEWKPISTSQKLIISATTGINDEKEDMLSIYPNPVTENLYIKGKEFENTNASIFNALGANVWSGKVTGQSINVSQLPAGIYLLRLGNKYEVKTIRFEKQ